VLSFNKRNLNEVFLREFLDDYISSITKFEPFGIHPELTEKIIAQLKSLTSLEFAVDSISTIKTQIDRLERQKKKLDSILEGNNLVLEEERRSFFPLIAKDAPEGFYGILESVTIRLNKAIDNDKFIIVPSEKEIERKILDQCKISWKVALDLSKEYVKKPYAHHEVIISFDKKDGFYEGNSLGIALTLSFLEQLLKFYNPTYIISIKEQTAFTGGISDTRKVLPTGEEIVKQKVKAIFFSEINTFVIPKSEEVYALNQLSEVQKDCPKRKLKIIPVEDIDDVMNRRDVVNIKKQKLIIRTGKFARKNWISAVVILLLTAILTYFLAVDLDDNPNNVSSDGNLLYIKNKNGKLLWTLYLKIQEKYKDKAEILKDYVQLVDIDYDGFNEIICTSGESPKENSINKYGTIVCLNKLKQKIWEYTFSDSAFCDHETLIPDYAVNLVDTCEINLKRIILCTAKNRNAFSSAIFLLDLRTGSRLKNTFWASGFIQDGIIIPLNNSTEKCFIGIGSDNGFHCGTIWGTSLEKLSGYRLSTPEYDIKNKIRAQLDFYIRLPKTDYDDFIGNNVLGLTQGSLSYNSKEKFIRFTTHTHGKLWGDESIICFHFTLSDNFKDFNISIADQFKVHRDSLVTRGILKKPYTNTKDYVELYKQGILYWKNGMWVKREQMD
jgi:hypothetical protein